MNPLATNAPLRRGVVVWGCPGLGQGCSVAIPMRPSGSTLHFELIVAAFSVCGCGGGSAGPQSEVTVTSTEGGVLQSDDGRFTLEIPAGAVSSPTTVRVRVGEAADVPAVAGIDDAVLVYLLEPTGLTLAEPASGRLVFDPVDKVGDAYPVPRVVHLSDEGSELELGDLFVAVDPGIETVATFEISSFSRIVTETTSDGTVAGPASGTGVVGVPFSLELAVNWSESGGIPAAHGTGSRPVISLTRCEDFMEGEVIADQPYLAAATYVCEAAGSADPAVYASKAFRVGGRPTRCRNIGLRVAIECEDHPSPSDVSAVQEFGDEVVLMTLLFGNNLYPRSQFTLSDPDSCDGGHWHASGPVFPITTASSQSEGIFRYVDLNSQQGLTDPAVGACGFGKATEVPQEALVLRKSQWEQFLDNHR